MTTPFDMERYARQTMLPEFGEERQRRIFDSSALLVGVGGLGSAAAYYLVGAGVGTIGLADSDVVSLSNLQRQVLYTEDEIGMPKTTAAERRLKAMSSNTKFLTFDEGINENNVDEIFSQFDIIIDCCDNFTTRFLIDDACRRLGKPWVHGSIGEFGGQVTVLNLGAKRHYSDLYPDREYLCSLPRTTRGVIGFVPGIIGSLQAGEALKVLGRFGTPLDGRLFTIDCKEMISETINF